MTPPYGILPDPVIAALPKLSDKAVRVAAALSGFMNGSGECWPSVAALIERSGLRKRQTVADAVAELAGAGLVSVHWRARRARVLAWAKVPLDGTIKSAVTRHNRGSESAVARTPKVPPHGTGNNTKNNTMSSHAGAKSKRASTEKAGPPVWKWWIEAHRDARRDDPIDEGPDTKAGKRLGKLVIEGKISPAQFRSVLALYLADDNRFLQENGHALRFLSGAKTIAYLEHVKELEPPPLDPAEIERIEARAAEAERVKA